MSALPTQPTRALLLNTCRHAFCPGHCGQTCGQRSTKRRSRRTPPTPLPLSLRSWLVRAPSVKGAGEEAWGSFSILMASRLLINFNFGLLGGPSRRKTHLTHSLTGSLSPSFFQLKYISFPIFPKDAKASHKPRGPAAEPVRRSRGGAPHYDRNRRITPEKKKKFSSSIL